jgi:hypothetical protein
VSVARAIFGHLRDTIPTLVDAGGLPLIYPSEGEDYGVFPRIVYEVNDEDRPRTYKGSSGLLESTVSVYCTDLTYKGSSDLADLVKAALDRQRGTWNGVVVQSCSYKSSSESNEQPAQGSDVTAYTRQLSFSVWISD